MATPFRSLLPFARNITRVWKAVAAFTGHASVGAKFHCVNSSTSKTKKATRNLHRKHTLIRNRMSLPFGTGRNVSHDVRCSLHSSSPTLISSKVIPNSVADGALITTSVSHLRICAGGVDVFFLLCFVFALIELMIFVRPLNWQLIQFSFSVPGGSTRTRRPNCFASPQPLCNVIVKLWGSHVSSRLFGITCCSSAWMTSFPSVRSFFLIPVDFIRSACRTCSIYPNGYNSN